MPQDNLWAGFSAVSAVFLFSIIGVHIVTLTVEIKDAHYLGSRLSRNYQRH